MIEKHNASGKEAIAEWLHSMCQEIDRTIVDFYVEKHNIESKELFDRKHFSYFCRFVKFVETVRKFDIDKDYHKFDSGIHQYLVKHPNVNYSVELARLVFAGEEENIVKMSEIEKANNPFTGHDGTMSPYSKKFIKYKDLPEDDVEKIIRDNHVKHVNTMNSNHNNPCRLDYYLKRGFTRAEALDKLMEHQKTFTLEKCISKYGSEAGEKKFRDRQVKWQQKLLSKPISESERIIKSRLVFSCGYSKMSQELFWNVYELIATKYFDIRFATLGKDGKRHDDENNENIVRINGCHYLMDFYVGDVKADIEFDGEYWHKNRNGDSIRDANISNAGYHILRISESEFLKSRKDTVDKCVRFLEECREKE